jgi:hypothetical protein
MFRKRAGRPRSLTSSGGQGASAASETRRAIRAERGSPARSQASDTNAEPEAIPPAQKYSGTSQVQTGAFIIPGATSPTGPVRARIAASAIVSGSGAEP